MAVQQAKSPTKAFVMALIFPGLGHLYVGRFLLFLVFLAMINPWTILYSLRASAWVTGAGPHNYLVLLFFPCALISQAIDAYLLAKAKNRAAGVMARRTGRKK
jgi:hypothetical protein